MLALKPIDYEASGKIVLSVDSSVIGWGAILQQEDDAEQWHPSRYENGLWTPAERKYDGGKLECRGLLKALKKLLYYLYGVRFFVEIDTKTLVHQLNQPASDLPGSVVNRWLAWIRLFDFDLRNVSGTKHRGPDSLSRRLRADEDLQSEGEDVEDAMDTDLAALNSEDVERGDRREEQVEAIGDEEVEREKEHEEAEEDIPEEFRKVICYLKDFERPKGLTRKKYLQFQHFATKFLLCEEGMLFR